MLDRGESLGRDGRVGLTEPSSRSSGFRQSLAADEKVCIKKLLAALDILCHTKETIPVQAVRTFLMVALNEGEGVLDYAEKLGISQSVASRHLLDIGDRDRYMKPGLGWITQRLDPINRRKHQALLTGTGKALAHRICRALAEA
jgi:DNA-binding MarR family transcriptional regulator